MLKWREEWQWEFRGFARSPIDTIVQHWLDGLPLGHRIEIAGLLRPLRTLTSTAWGRPFFDPLDGEGGISEIIVPSIRDDLGIAYYRLYGWFGPEKHVYTILHGRNKKAKNDKEGKAIARANLEELRNNRATAIRLEI
jgi:hypothetical protein